MTTAAINAAARTIACNKSNWSGEEITVEVAEDGSFEYAGYNFRMVESKPLFCGATDDEEPTEEWTYYEYSCFMGDETEYPTAKVGKFGRDKHWDAHDDGHYCSRQDGDAWVAIIQILCNIV